MDDTILEIRESEMNRSPSRSLPQPMSPSTEKKILENEKIRIENEKLKDEWGADGGCCSRTDKHFIKYISQVSFSACVVIFSMVQIARGADNREIYFSLISGIIGNFSPTPNILPKRGHP